MKLPTYYPQYATPIHEVQDWCKVRKMIRALRAGESLPPIYVDGERGNGNLLSGTHRIAASEIRARLDDILPYRDLDIIDVSDKLAELEDWQRETNDYDDLLAAMGLSGS